MFNEKGIKAYKKEFAVLLNLKSPVKKKSIPESEKLMAEFEKLSKKLVEDFNDFFLLKHGLIVLKISCTGHISVT